jgi:hypothetical protein
VLRRDASAPRLRMPPCLDGADLGAADLVGVAVALLGAGARGGGLLRSARWRDTAPWDLVMS